MTKIKTYNVSKVNWNELPDDAQFYSVYQVRKHENGNEYVWDDDGSWREVKFDKIETHKLFDDFELRTSLDDSNCNTYNPDETPDYDESLDDKWDSGELGQSEDSVVVVSDHIAELASLTLKECVERKKEPNILDKLERIVEDLESKHGRKTSIQFLDEVKAIQEERAAEYEQDGGERSFAKIATVFNTYTGHNLQPSDIALILEILKNVRFYSNTGYHKDSVIDALSYTSLWAELVTQERDKR